MRDELDWRINLVKRQNAEIEKQRKKTRNRKRKRKRDGTTFAIFSAMQCSVDSPLEKEKK